MMSDQLLDEIARGLGVTLNQVRPILPSARKGKPATRSRLVRWILDGVTAPDGRRVRLEAVRLAGKWVTTPQAIARFAAAQTPRLGSDDAVPAPRPAAHCGRPSEHVGHQLDALGL
jgi:hypothetical protein